MPHALRPSRRRRPSWTLALWANAAAVALVGFVLLSRDGPSLTPAALAQQGPIAGGAGLFLMPAQLATNAWGCYVMDVDRQTLMVYQYQIGNGSGGPGNMLKLMASRDFTNDRRLRRFNTTPNPDEVKKLLDMETPNAAAK